MTSEHNRNIHIVIFNSVLFIYLLVYLFIIISSSISGFMLLIYLINIKMFYFINRKCDIIVYVYVSDFCGNNINRHISKTKKKQYFRGNRSGGKNIKTYCHYNMLCDFSCFIYLFYYLFSNFMSTP